MKKYNQSCPVRQPAKFPLGKHKARGYWIKKVKGKIHYFGRIEGDEDGQAALEEWLRVKDDLLAGRTPAAKTDKLTVLELVNQYLNAKRLQVESGELKARSHREYRLAAERLTDAIGKMLAADSLGPSDFERVRSEITKHCGPTRTKNEITRIKGIFRWAYKQGLIRDLPRYGAAFEPPSAKTIRVAKAVKGNRLFTPDEIGTLLSLANVRQRAHILLALNGGFGQSDLSELPFHAIDLQAGWVDFPRVKTGAPRRCWLWPETCRAVQEAINDRVAPADPSYGHLVFLTRYGLPLVRDFKGCAEDTVAIRFRALLKRAGLADSGLSFYRLRHTHRHVTDMAGDQPAANLIMGHIDQTIPGNYRGTVGDDRLRRVSELLRAWLFPPAAADPDEGQERPEILRFTKTG